MAPVVTYRPDLYPGDSPHSDATTAATARDKDLHAAERALHERAELSFDAARRAGSPGLFETREVDGLFMVLTTSPGLGFLNSITGVTPSLLDALPGALAFFAEANASGPSVSTAPWSPGSVPQRLEQLGFQPVSERPLAYLKPSAAELGSGESSGQWAVHEVVDADDLDLFVELLLAGYASGPPVSAFIAAEHLAAGVRRFVAWRGGRPLAAAGLSQHGDSLVLGGAATSPAARGMGAQSELLRCRVRIALEQNVAMAVAGCAPRSPSMRNLRRAGFSIIERRAWRGCTSV